VHGLLLEDRQDRTADGASASAPSSVASAVTVCLASAAAFMVVPRVVEVVVMSFVMVSHRTCFLCEA
jgi:hypothetical protein